MKSSPHRVKTGKRHYGAVLIVTHQGLNTIYELKSSVISIGRHRHNHIVITNKTLSRHHAYLWKMACGDSLQFQLLEGEIGGGPSSNGTFVNNQRVDTQSLLTDGGILTFGVHIKARYLCHNYFDVNYIDSLQSQYGAQDTVAVLDMPTILSPEFVTQPDGDVAKPALLLPVPHLYPGARV